MGEVIFLNGKFLAVKDAKISVLEPGFLYGWGVFETMRSYNNIILHFDEHLERIQKSAKFLSIGFPYPHSKLKAIIQEAVKISGSSDCYVRLTLWKKEPGAGVLIMVRKYIPHSERYYKRGLGAAIAQFRQSESSLLAGIKTTNRILYEMSLKEANKKNFDEALILNNRGCIAEATRSNIFWVKNKGLFTPSLECGCLEGITREVVLGLARKKMIKTHQGKFYLEDLYAADEAFLTNSMMGIMPLVRIGKKGIGRGSNFLTRSLRQEYNSFYRRTK